MTTRKPTLAEQVKANEEAKSQNAKENNKSVIDDVSGKTNSTTEDDKALVEPVNDPVTEDVKRDDNDVEKNNKDLDVNHPEHDHHPEHDGNFGLELDKEAQAKKDADKEAADKNKYEEDANAGVEPGALARAQKLAPTGYPLSIYQGGDNQVVKAEKGTNQYNSPSEQALSSKTTHEHVYAQPLYEVEAQERTRREAEEN